MPNAAQAGNHVDAGEVARIVPASGREAPMHPRRRPFLAASLAVAIAFAAAAAGAQSPRSHPAVAAAAPVPAAAGGRAAERVDRPLLVAVNPIGAIFGSYQVDVERAIDRSSSIGLEASYFDGDLVEDGEDDEDDWLDGTYVRSSVGVHYRYYPRAVFQGLSVDGTAGWARVEDGDLCFFDPDEDCGRPERASTVHFGFELGWSWLPGDEDRLSIGLALGARRHIVTGGDEIDGKRAFATPAGRFAVGLRF